MLEDLLEASHREMIERYLKKLRLFGILNSGGQKMKRFSGKKIAERVVYIYTYTRTSARFSTIPRGVGSPFDGWVLVDTQKNLRLGYWPRAAPRRRT